MIFSQKVSGYCWICGRTESLSGEHKIKKADLKRHPESVPKYMISADGERQIVQGLNSKLLKFNKSICAQCNNSATQQADRSYDAFRNDESQLVRTTVDKLGSILDPTIEHELDLSYRIDVARYFGKHLGCALAYNEFPIPRRLSRFVGCRSDEICISVATRVAPYWWQNETGEIIPLHALGGAILLFGADPFKFPCAYQSAYMTDGMQFIVKMRLSLPEAVELILRYAKAMRKFIFREDNNVRKCRGLPYDD